MSGVQVESNCKCQCHIDIEQMSHQLQMVISKNQSLSHQLEDAQTNLHSKDIEISILTEKNSIVNNLIIQQDKQYKELLSQYEKLQLHQKYIPSPPSIDQDNTINQLESMIITLKQQNNTLKLENNKLLKRHHTSEEQNMLLSTQLNTSIQLCEALQASAIADHEVIQLMKHNSAEVMDELNHKNQQIDHLREKLAINNKHDSLHSDTYNPITSNMKQTMRMDDLSHFKTSPLFSPAKDPASHTRESVQDRDRMNNSHSNLYPHLILAGEKVRDRVHDKQSQIHESSYFHVSELGDTAHTFYLDVVDETMHSAPMEDHMDSYAYTNTRSMTARSKSRPTSSRFTNERQYSQLRDLQGLVFEYETKEKEWGQEREDLEMELINKCMQLEQMKKEFDEERDSHARKIEDMMKIQNPEHEEDTKCTLIGSRLQDGNKGWEKVLTEDDELEISPISGEDGVRDEFFRNDEDDIDEESNSNSSDDPPGCVCFSFRLW